MSLLHLSKEEIEYSKSYHRGPNGQIMINFDKKESDEIRNERYRRLKNNVFIDTIKDPSFKKMK